jgi:hypothetical protein
MPAGRSAIATPRMAEPLSRSALRALRGLASLSTAAPSLFPIDHVRRSHPLKPRIPVYHPPLAPAFRVGMHHMTLRVAYRRHAQGGKLPGRTGSAVPEAASSLREKNTSLTHFPPLFLCRPRNSDPGGLNKLSPDLARSVGASRARAANPSENKYSLIGV